jgi:hypothetical protein
MRKAIIGILTGTAMIMPVIVDARPVTDENDFVRVREDQAAQPSRGDDQRRAENGRQDEGRQERVQSVQVERPRPVRQEQRAERQNFRRDNQDARRDYREVRRDNQDARRDYREVRMDVQEVRRDNQDIRRDYRDARRDYRTDRRQDRRDWNRGWRNDNRYDWRRWRNQNRSIFSIGRYYAPYRNHRYSRFSIGIRLGPIFFSNRYWIADPWRYRLPPAYAGTKWIRYYDDALLVDLYTGEVIDVIYDFFW